MLKDIVEILSEEEKNKKTLKDMDFDRLEQKVWLSKDDCQEVKRVLVNDSHFFANNGLIDYSLIVIKVDYAKYCQQGGAALNRRTMFPSQQEEGVMYLLGIIDYLETWNLRKKGEKWYKSFFTTAHSISSQSPDFYCERFCGNLIDKIFATPSVDEEAR